MPLTLTKHLQSQTKDQSQAKKEDILLKSSKQVEAVHMLFCHCYFVEVILVAGKRQCLPFHLYGPPKYPLTISTTTAAKKGQM